MAQALTLKQLTDKVTYLEEEISNLRKELVELREQTSKAPDAAITQLAFPFANKAAQKRWISNLFASSQIRGTPIGPQELQKKMSQSELTRDELSKGLIEAREE